MRNSWDWDLKNGRWLACPVPAVTGIRIACGASSGSPDRRRLTHLHAIRCAVGQRDGSDLQIAGCLAGQIAG
jgi:hypothetical protein